MDLTFTLESFDSLYACWQNFRMSFRVVHCSRHLRGQKCGGNTSARSQALFGCRKTPGESLGIAPLLVRGKVAGFIGSKDVCDYLDFVVAPGKETVFFDALLDSLAKAGITQLDLAPLRPDSTALTFLVDIAPKHGWQVSIRRTTSQ